MTYTVVALYDDFATAEAVIRDLAANGFSKDAMSFVASDEDAEARRRIAAGGKAPSEPGAAGDLFAAMQTHRLPGIGTVLEAGRLAERTADERTGLVAALKDEGVDENDAANYSEGIRRGGTLVTVAADEREADRAEDIMVRQGPVDLARRIEEWRNAGWTRSAAEAEPLPAERERRGTLGTEEQVRVPIAEEEMHVGKREVERRGVRIHARTVTRPVEERVTLREEHIRVERRQVPERPATAEDLEEAFRERTIEIAEHAEEALISKEARVTGEVVIGKETIEREEIVRGEVRHTEVDVDDETVAPLGAPGGRETRR